MRRFITMLLGASLLLSVPAFAQSAADIPTAYVPETNYKRLKCEELFQESARAENDLAVLVAQLQDYRSRYFIDLLALGMPLTTLGGNTVAAETYLEHNISHIKGELRAISLMSDRKSCKI